MSTLSTIGWYFAFPPAAWLNRKLLTLVGRGPGLIVEHGTQYVQERKELKVNQPAVFEEGKDMLYRFMSLKDTQTLDDSLLIKVKGNDLCLYTI